MRYLTDEGIIDDDPYGEVTRENVEALNNEDYE